MSSFQTLLSNSSSTHQTQLYFPNTTHFNIPNFSKCSFIHRPFESLHNNRRPNYNHFKSNIRTQAAHTNLEALFGAAVQENTLEKELGEIQKLLLTIQDQQKKQLELTHTLANGGNLLETKRPSYDTDNGKISTFDDMSLIGLESMKQANSTLEDFCRSYYMFHGLDVTRPECIFKYLPLFSYIEGYVYKLDTLNEKVIDAIRGKTAVGDQRSIEEAYCLSLEKSLKFLESDPFGPLMQQLHRSGLLTERIRQEFNQGVQYWALERKICVTTQPIPVSIEEVLKAIHYKGTDYRVMNLLLYQLEGHEINELHMEFLSVCEFLVEISDDLFDYEDDVLKNTFNALRLFVNIYGPSAAPTMLAKCIAEKEEKYKELGKALDPELYKKYQIRSREAAIKGDKMAGYPLGSWNIPQVIADEDGYRSSKQNCP